MASLGKLRILKNYLKIDEMKHFDCVVIGGGMVGAASAVSLAQLGLKVAVIEPFKAQAFSQQQPFDLRVSAISLASINLLKQLGVWQQIKQWRTCSYKRLGVYELDNLFTEFNAQDIEQNELGHIVENRLIQLALWQQINTMDNIEALCPEKLTSLTQLEDKAIVELTNTSISAKLVVGADGGQSNVRKMSGIGVTGWGYQQSAMLINIETSLAQQDITWQQFHSTGPVAFLPLPGKSDLGGYASLVWYHSRDEISRLSALNNAQLEQEISAAFPKQIGTIKVIDKGAFPLTRQHANAYQNQRVVLLGDAAHTINPMAGQGVNLGFKDVLALQHVISSAIGSGKCWHENHVLAGYEKARRHDNLMMMSTMDALYVSFSHPSPLVKLARNTVLFSLNKLPVLSTTVKNKALKYACGI